MSVFFGTLLCSLLCGLLIGNTDAQTPKKKTPSRKTTKTSSAKQVKQKTKEASFRDTAMLAKVFFKYRGMKALTQNAHGTMTINADGVNVKADISSTLTLAQPNRFRFDSHVNFLGQDRHGSVISDGTTVWDVNEDTKEYAEHALAPLLKDEKKFTDWLMDRAGIDLTAMMFLEAATGEVLGLPAGMDKVIEIPNYPTRMIDGLAMYVLPVVIDKKDSGGDKTDASLYVDAKEMLIRRCRFNIVPKATKGTPKNLKVDIVLFYEQIKPDPDVPEDAFAFTPPADAKKVEKVVPVFSRAFDQ